MKVKLSVLMTVFNDEKYIKESIDSVLNQSYRNFIFIIINDASTDGTKNIIETISDRRIRLYNLDYNIGQTAALNYGLQCIDTEYVVRMDSDDISEPTRFDQLMNIEQLHNYDFIGSACIEFNEVGKKTFLKKYEADNDIYKNYFNFNQTPFVHGSLLFKYSAIKELNFYNENFKVCADYDLYKRIYFHKNKFKVHNLKSQLYLIRRHNNQLTKSNLAIKEIILIKWSVLFNLLNKKEFKKSLSILFNLMYFYIIFFLSFVR
jgi:glycosyltransferase involved in cell wall biosynthesis